MLNIIDSGLISLPFNHLDNASFNAALYELSHGPLNYDTDRSGSLLFNPIEQPKSSDSYTRNLDPDEKFSFCPTASNYYVEHEINSKVATD